MLNTIGGASNIWPELTDARYEITAAKVHTPFKSCMHGYLTCMRIS